MKKNLQDFIEASIVSRENLSAYEFLTTVKRNPENIKSVSFVPPVIGGKGFGSFDVQYNTPRLVTN